MKQALRAGYNSLTTDQAQAVMNKYGADYLLTSTTHPLDLAIAYQNSRYILYARSLESGTGNSQKLKPWLGRV